jgi:integrase
MIFPGGVMKFTVRSTAALELTPGKLDFVAFDDALAGFGLRLRAGGSRSWIFQYAVSNRQRRMVIGKATALPLDKAREIAAQLHAKVKLGGDPAGDRVENRARSGETFEACMKLYLARRRTDVKLRASSYAEIERHLVRNLRALHGLRIDKVDRRAIALELTRLTAKGPVQANRTRQSLVKFMNWCAREGFIDTNPAVFTNKNSEAPRDRVLADAELRAIWRALPDGDFGDIVKLLALTGQRAREISELRWDEIDLARGVITLPAPRTKNRRAHTIPLPAPAAAILSARVRNADRELVFGATGRRGFSGWSACKRQLDEQIKIAPWVIHDLRRTVSTGMNELGVAPWVVETVLNHISGSKGGVAGRYNYSQLPAEKAAALVRWAEHLMAVVEDRTSNITPLRA